MQRLAAVVLTASLAMALVAANTHAAAPAFDSASDIEYTSLDPTFPTGLPTWEVVAPLDNGGVGFAPWAGVPGAGGFFMGSSVGNGDGLDNGIIGGLPGDGDINTFNAVDGVPQAWGMFSGPGALTEAVRPFALGPLLPGETFSIDFDNGFVAAGGGVGLTLQIAAGPGLPVPATTAWEFGFAGGAPTYYIIDGLTGPAGAPIPVPFTDEGLNISFTMVGPGAYTATITPRGGAPFVIPASPTLAAGPILQARLFSFSNPGGPAFDLFANNMSIVPEPTTLTLVGLGLIGLLSLRRRVS